MDNSPKSVVFELRTLPDSSDETLLTELRRVAALIPDGPLTREIFRQHGRGAKRIYNRFGSWHEALAAAGLSHRSSDVIVVRGAHPARNMNDEQVLEALRSLAARFGTDELTAERVEEHLPFGRATLAKRWGSAQAAFQAAGLTPSRLGRRYTAEQCHNNMLVVWTHYGRPPKYSEMSLPPSQVGGKAYMLRFGTWNKALAAFVERVNAETQEREDDSEPAPSASARPLAVPQSPPMREGEDARGIPLGLRFRVLHRDRFKCVLCGDHPARNLECRLHVDHIVPWSKGGRTQEDNLRALCEGCNVGRSNRFLD